MELPGARFKAKLEKKTHSPKNHLYFGKWNSLALILKTFLTFGKQKPRKKFLIFQETETLKSSLYFGEYNFSAQARKIKKKPPQENFLYSWKMELCSSNIKKFRTFSQEEAVLIFQEMDTPKKIPYISGNGTFLYFRKQKP